MKKLLLSLIATIALIFTVNSLSAQVQSPMPQDSVSRDTVPNGDIPLNTDTIMSEPTTPIPNTDPFPVPDTSTYPVNPEPVTPVTPETPDNPTTPQIPEEPALPAPPAPTMP